MAALLPAGCTRASPADCRKGCERAAQHLVAEQRKQAMMSLHELEERLESTERQVNADLADLRAQLAAPVAAFDEKPFRARKASAAEIRMARDRYAAETAQLEVQRKDGIRRATEALAEEHRQYDAAKKQSDAGLAKATAGEVEACSARCVRKSPGFAACLSRTQAAEDVAACETG